MNKVLAILLLSASMSACTSVEVQPVATGTRVPYVCIEKNTKVSLDDFIVVVRDGFFRHGIETELVGSPAPKRCTAVLTYNAQANWDFVAYLIHAELKLAKDDRIIGSAQYHLAGTGGLAPAKWASTKSKMDPVIDRLLANVEAQPAFYGSPEAEATYDSHEASP